MSENQSFDVIIVTTAADYRRVSGNAKRIFELVPAEHFIFVGNREVGELVSAAGYDERVGFIDEDSLIPFNDVHAVVKDILNRDDVPRGITGWYYQQFLKMKYADISSNEYYMSWDGDTVPCKEFSMFECETGTPFFDVKTEYHEEYFVTLAKLFPNMKKVIGKSFISEHMLFNKNVMHELIYEIEANCSLNGVSFYERILRSIRAGKLESNSFSEFETYGTYVSYKHQNMYKLRNWHSIRYGSIYFVPCEMTDEDYRWLGIDFDAVSYEKNQEFLPELSKYFMTKEYRAKLSPRYIVETIQDYSSEGMREEWDDYTDKISVIIPVYNEEKYISQCLDSIMLQTYRQDCMEIIIVDDCSDDGTLGLLKHYEEMYPSQIMLILLDEHIGYPGKSRNIGLQYVTGDYIAFVDADDTIDRDYLSHLIDIAKKNDCDITSCSYDLFNEGGLMNEDIFPDAIYDMSDVVQKKNYLLTDGTRTNAWGRLYKTTFVRNLGARFAENYHISEDAFFVHTCMMNARKCALTSKPKYHYRVKDNSLFHNAETNYAKDILECYTRLTKNFADSIFWDVVSAEYEAIFFFKAIVEFLDYCNEHNVTADKQIELMQLLIDTVRRYYSGMLNNKYLGEDNKNLLGAIFKI